MVKNNSIALLVFGCVCVWLSPAAEKDMANGCLKHEGMAADSHLAQAVQKRMQEKLAKEKKENPNNYNKIQKELKKTGNLPAKNG